MKKKLLLIATAFVFVVMMSINITSSINGTDISLVGITALASGTSGGSCAEYCQNHSSQNNGRCVSNDYGCHFCSSSSWYQSDDCKQQTSN